LAGVAVILTHLRQLLLHQRGRRLLFAGRQLVAVVLITTALLVRLRETVGVVRCTLGRPRGQRDFDLRGLAVLAVRSERNAEDARGVDRKRQCNRMAKTLGLVKSRYRPVHRRYCYVVPSLPAIQSIN